MTPKKAEEIVNEFRDILSNKKSTFSNSRELPHSPGMIKHAFFVYGEAMTKDSLLKEEEFNALTMEYGRIDINFVEDPEKSTKIYENLKVEDVVKAFEMISPQEKAVEFHNFLVDCEGGW